MEMIILLLILIASFLAGYQTGRKKEPKTCVKKITVSDKSRQEAYERQAFEVNNMLTYTGAEQSDYDSLLAFKR